MPLSLCNAHLHAGVEVTAPWLSTVRASGMCLHVISEKPADVLEKCATSNTRSFSSFSMYHNTRRRCGVHKFSKTCRSHLYVPGAI